MCREKKINSIEKERVFLEKCLKKMTKDIGEIPIANTKIMPMGWRKAAKGRTVWRIIEEIISQNLETKYEEYGFESVSTSDSEVSVYDFQFKHPLGNTSYVNIKSSVLNGKKNKDDISKANGLELFYRENPEANLYISTFVLDFKKNMTIDIVDVIVFPVPWIPDIYINPSNNGNLQSSKYKNLDEAIKRTNSEFLKEFDEAYNIAIKKGLKKLSR
ncbi:MAG: hypothetical protein ACLUOP_13650 [Intestinibacter bartlettii]